MFEVESIDKGGRIAKLDIKGKTIRAPIYSPTLKSISQAQRSDRVDESDIEYNIGVNIEWFDHDDLKNLTEKSTELDARIEETKEKFNELKSDFKVLHLEFYGQATSISDKTLEKLMEFQLSTGTNLIEIPNYYDSEVDYGHTINIVLKWLKKNDKNNTPILATALEPEHINIIKKYKDKFFGVGVNQRRQNIPLLVEFQKTFKKDKKLYTIAFMLPRAYSIVGRQGTMGPLVNFFGFDSYSLAITNPKSTKGFGKYYYGVMTKEEKLTQAEEGKYFKRDSYATPTFSEINYVHGGSKDLGDFCSCKVCKGITIGRLIESYENTYPNNRAHEFLSYNGESTEFRKEIENGKGVDYIKRKEYPKRITGI